MGRVISRTRFGILGWQLLSLGVLALAWEAAVRLGIADPLFVPAPGAVARALGATAGATRWQIGRKVLVPAVLPSVLAGMRIGMVFAMLGVLLAEMFAGNRGMGFQMQRLAMAFKAPELFAATAIVSMVSIAVVLFLE